MNTKKRLFEVFSKVNKTPLIEEADDIITEIKEDIMWELKQDPKMFSTEIPYVLQLHIKENDVTVRLDDDKPLTYENTVENQINYTANYNFEVDGITFELSIPIILNVNKVSDGKTIKFKNEIWFDNLNVDVTKK